MIDNLDDVKFGSVRVAVVRMKSETISTAAEMDCVSGGQSLNNQFSSGGIELHEIRRQE